MPGIVLGPGRGRAGFHGRADKRSVTGAAFICLDLSAEVIKSLQSLGSSYPRLPFPSKRD